MELHVFGESNLSILCVPKFLEVLSNQGDLLLLPAQGSHCLLGDREDLEALGDQADQLLLTLASSGWRPTGPTALMVGKRRWQCKYVTEFAMMIMHFK